MIKTRKQVKSAKYRYVHSDVVLVMHQVTKYYGSKKMKVENIILISRALIKFNYFFYFNFYFSTTTVDEKITQKTLNNNIKI